MKALLVATAAMVIIVSSWGIFVSYSDKEIHELMNTIEDDILIDVYAGDWGKAESQFKQLSKEWHQQKKIYSFFFNNIDVNETDYAIARAKDYIKAKDAPLAAGELNCIKEQLKFLHFNELVSVDNIF
jgi:hypothetical protein